MDQASLATIPAISINVSGESYVVVEFAYKFGAFPQAVFELTSFGVVMQ